MKKKDFIKRWTDAVFVSENKRNVDQAFASGVPLQGLDLRGITVGKEGPLQLHFVSLNEKKIIETDFSYSTLVCSFHSSKLSNTIFNECLLEDASFDSATLIKCSFEKAKLTACSFDDAVVKDCIFIGAKLQDRRSIAFSGLRSTFEECKFDGANLKNVEFRATKIINSSFEGTTFKNCDFRGVRFIGTAPNVEQLKNCELTGVTLDGEALS